MKQRMAVVFVALIALAVVSSSVVAQSPDPSIGTWKVNLPKSTYSPGPNAKCGGDGQSGTVGGWPQDHH